MTLTIKNGELAIGPQGKMRKNGATCAVLINILIQRIRSTLTEDEIPLALSIHPFLNGVSLDQRVN